MLDSRTLIAILVFALILFGTARLRSMGVDVGAALKGFRRATRDNDAPVQFALPEPSSRRD
jgi:TatA/E family protein of Tat protein translocase